MPKDLTSKVCYLHICHSHLRMATSALALILLRNGDTSTYLSVRASSGNQCSLSFASHAANRSWTSRSGKNTANIIWTSSRMCQLNVTPSYGINKSPRLDSVRGASITTHYSLTSEWDRLSTVACGRNMSRNKPVCCTTQTSKAAHMRIAHPRWQ